MTVVERVRVTDVLALRRRTVAVDPDKEYRLVGVYSFGKGIFHREPKGGSELGNYRYCAIEPGDLVLSNIQAWEGAIGYATASDEGAVGTHRFLTYVPISDRIDANWARWFFLSEPGMALIRQAAPGSTMRNRTLAIARFEALEIPLPPIDEQRRLASRLNEIELARAGLERYASHVAGLIDALTVSIATRPDLSDSAKKRVGWSKVELGSIMQQANDAVPVVPGRTYRNLGIYGFGRGLFAKQDIDGSVTSAKGLTRVHAGQFIYSRLFAFEGAFSYVPPAFDGFYVSNEFPTFDVDPESLDARWLAAYLRSHERWSELASSSKGLGVRRQRVPIEAVLAYEVWLPPRDRQRAAVETMDRVDGVRNLRTQSDQRIKALVPSALNAMFAGLDA